MVINICVMRKICGKLDFDTRLLGGHYSSFPLNGSPFFCVRPGLLLLTHFFGRGHDDYLLDFVNYVIMFVFLLIPGTGGRSQGRG